MSLQILIYILMFPQKKFLAVKKQKQKRNGTKWELCKRHQCTKGILLPLMSVQLGFSLSNEEGKGEEGRVEGNMPGDCAPKQGYSWHFGHHGLHGLHALNASITHPPKSLCQRKYPLIFPKVGGEVRVGGGAVDRLLDIWNLTIFYNSRVFT